jgi:hypothetical protein
MHLFSMDGVCHSNSALWEITDPEEIIPPAMPEITYSILSVGGPSELPHTFVGLVVDTEEIEDQDVSTKSRTVVKMTDRNGLGFKFTLFANLRQLARKMARHNVYEIGPAKVVV